MVLKRKLPSSIGESVASPAEQSDLSAETREENSSKTEDVLEATAAPEKEDEPLEDISAPIAPEPEVPETLDASVAVEDMTIPVIETSLDTPIAPPSFGEDSIEASPSTSMPAEPESGEGWTIDDLMPQASPAGSMESTGLELPEQPLAPAAKPIVEPITQPDIGNLPPWQQNTSFSEPPILPGTGDDLGEGSKKKAFVGLLLIVLLASGAYYAFVERGDKTTERLARITNALEEVSEEPLEEASVQPEKVQTTPSTQVTEVDLSTSEPDESGQPFLDFPAEGEFLDIDTGEVAPDDVDAVLAKAQKQTKTPGEKTIVEFVDVSEAEVDELITGEEAEAMPEDVTNFVDRWKNAVEQAEAKRQGEVEVKEDEESGEEVVENLPPEEVERRNDEKLKDLEEELSAYRRILAGGEESTPKKVSPKDFFYGDKGKMAGRQGDVKSQEQAASMYGANPYNLPVVSEPSKKSLQKIRTLDDFDVTMFEPERKRVRIPKAVHPTFKAHEFPQVYLLSLLPGQGVVAQNRGKQGVLMLGESVEGWELVAVASQYAEFRKGKRRHVLAINGIQ